MTTLVDQSHSIPRTEYQEPYDDQNEWAPLSTHKDGLLVKVARHIEIFSDQLGGPPMSRRDRVRHDLVTAQHVRQAVDLW